MTTPTTADLNAPPGGPAGSQVITTTPNTPPVAPQVPDPEALKLNPAPPSPDAPPVPPSTPSPDVPDFGDPGLNVAADYFVNQLGLSLDSPELSEAAKGNYAYLEAKLAQLGDKAKGAEAYVQLAKSAQERVQKNARAHVESTIKSIHEAVGGETNWTAIKSFAQSNLSQDDLGEASAALHKGGISAVAMAKYLHAAASASPSVNVQGNPTTSPVAAAAPIVPASQLSREEYRAEYRKLIDKHGIMGAQRSHELAALNARLRR